MVYLLGPNVVGRMVVRYVLFLSCLEVFVSHYPVKAIDTPVAGHMEFIWIGFYWTISLQATLNVISVTDPISPIIVSPKAIMQVMKGILKREVPEANDVFTLIAHSCTKTWEETLSITVRFPCWAQSSEKNRWWVIETFTNNVLPS